MVVGAVDNCDVHLVECYDLLVAIKTCPYGLTEAELSMDLNFTDVHVGEGFLEHE